MRDLHERYGHIQEIIIQNFRAKPGTRMATAPEPDLADHLWTIAVARLIFGPEMNIQAPPNLMPEALEDMIAAGINDWGGVSPVTPDHVNPEAPWPALDRLARRTAGRRQAAGRAAGDLPGLHAVPGALARRKAAHPGIARDRRPGPRPPRRMDRRRRHRRPPSPPTPLPRRERGGAHVPLSLWERG